MIRFSAALVAVAIGVLIGGIATSELLLVYIAIVVSAVALVALAIGVVLKRGELFGEGQGLVPAAAGLGPVLPARAGEGQAPLFGENGQAGTHVAPSPPFAGATAGYVGGTTPASPSTAAAPSAPRTAAAGPGRPAEPVPPWESQAARGPWSPVESRPAPDWMPAGQGDRAAGAAGATAARTPSAWQQDTTPPVAQGGWGGQDADAQAAATAPRPWAPQSTPPVPGPPDVKPAGGSASAAPSWFDRLGGQASTVTPTSATGAPATPAVPTVAAPTVSTPTGAPPAVPGGPVPRENVAGGTESGKPASSETDAGHTDSGNTRPGNTGSGNTGSGNTGAVDDDDDWPTRYSWLEDDGDESGEGGEATGSADGTTGASASAAATVAAPSLDAGTTALGSTALGSTAPGTTGDGTPDHAAGDVADADEAEEPDAHIIAFPGHAAAPAPSSANGAGPHGGRADEASADPEDDDPEADTEAETGPTATADADNGADATDPTVANGAALVTVVPGVPRYHRPDCVLIRFMPEGDVQKLPVAEAKDAGCTPCAACQPTG